MQHAISPSARTRRTPFSDRVEACDVSAYTVYNRTLLATAFASVEEDYHHLKRAVQVWDVSCEKQVELRGPDAAKLLQMTTPRDLTRMADDQCYYVPLVDAKGYMLNDPVAVKLADDRFWVSLADSDALLYYKGLASGFGLDVDCFEPEVYPLAIQGPKADDLAAAVFGPSVRDLRFFRHQQVDVCGRSMLLARSGWSKQGGFELYLDTPELAETVWDQLMEAGAPMDVRAGCPNGIERIEAGLLSFGNDITTADTPFEVGLGKYCHASATECLAHEALQTMATPKRQLRPIEIETDTPPRSTQPWVVMQDNQKIGEVRSAAYSPDMGTTVAIAMLDAEQAATSTSLTVDTPDGTHAARARDGYWI